MNPTLPAAGEILVAVKFDEATEALVDLAQTLAERSCQRLRLVHVLSRELPLHVPDREFGMPLDLDAESLIEIDENLTGRLESAHLRLSELAGRRLKDGVRFGTEVLIGEFPDALTEFAAVRAATLVVTGATRRQPGLLRSRLRRTCRLMARTDVPVLVVPEPRRGQHPSDGMTRILIADDLSPSGLPAVQVIADLVGLGIRADVLHLHVTPPPVPGAGGDRDRSWEIWPGISVEDRLYNDHHEHLLDRLHARADLLQRRLAARRGFYVAELWQGNVREEISRATAIHQPDLTVFGRHHFLKRQPFALGQMPFASMLGVGSAVLVAPPATHSLA